MNAVEIIQAKRDGGRLSDAEIDWFLSSYTAGTEVADEQAAALAMAIYFNGLDSAELATWTQAMINSGTKIDLSGIGKPTVDKHSTGGVGDKVSLILVPLIASFGIAVPQISGRGLGHTGGTLDKMEAIAGWQAELSATRMNHVLRSVGGVIAGASAELAPADRKLYALRDVTGTIESIPLIASSIMSKKIAEGTKALVLDVKVGRGAFMPDVESATELARTMVDIGATHGVKTSALLTRMDDVLGRSVGNGLEVQEAIDVLKGQGPADVIELTVALAEEMLRLAGVNGDPASVLASGAAYATFEHMVIAQGGDLAAGLPEATVRRCFCAKTAGYVHTVDARAVGVAAWHLGAGRSRKEDSINPSAGIICRVKPGDWVISGQPLLEFYADDQEAVDRVLGTIGEAVVITSERHTPEPIIMRHITDAGAIVNPPEGS